MKFSLKTTIIEIYLKRQSLHKIFFFKEKDLKKIIVTDNFQIFLKPNWHAIFAENKTLALQCIFQQAITLSFPLSHPIPFCLQLKITNAQMHISNAYLHRSEQ